MWREKADDQSQNGERHREDQTQRAENERCSNLKRDVRPRLQGEARLRELVARSLQPAGNDTTDARLQARSRIRLPRRKSEDERAHCERCRERAYQLHVASSCASRRASSRAEGFQVSWRIQDGALSAPRRASKSSVSAYSPSPLTPSSAAMLADDPQARALPSQDHDDVEDARDVGAQVGEAQVMHALAGQELNAEECVLG